MRWALLLLTPCMWAQEEQMAYIVPTIAPTYKVHVSNTWATNTRYPGQRLNLLSFTEFPAANVTGIWANTNSTRATVYTNLPTGVSSATYIDETSATGNHNIVQSPTAISNWIITGWFKGTANRGIWLSLTSVTGYIDQTDCSTYTSSGSFTMTKLSGPDVNGWCNIAISSTSVSVSQIKIGSATNTGGKTYASFANSFTGASGNGVYFANVQLQAGQTATAYEPSPYGDALLVTAGWKGFAIGTVGTYSYVSPSTSLTVDMSSPWSILYVGDAIAADTKYVLGLADHASTNNIVGIVKNGNLGVRITVTQGGNTTTSNTITLASSTTVIDGRTQALLLRNDSGTLRLQDLLAGTEVTLSAGSLSGWPRICVGCDGSSSMGNVGVNNWRGVWYWPRWIPDYVAKTQVQVFKAASPQEVIATGDSLTYGTGAGNPNEWPSQAIWQTAQDVLHADTWMTNAGIGGQKVQDLVTRIGNQMGIFDPMIKKHACVLWIGTNDIATRTAAAIEADIASTVAQMSACSPLVVATITMRCDGNGDEAKRAAINTYILNNAAAWGARVADLGSDSTLNNSTACSAGTTPFYTDKVHYLTAGYQQAAELVVTQLKAGGLQ